MAKACAPSIEASARAATQEERDLDRAIAMVFAAALFEEGCIVIVYGRVPVIYHM